LAVFVAAFTDDRVLRVDPRTLDVRRSAKVCSGPQGMVEAAGRLWVVCTFSDEVVALDPVALERTSRIPVKGLPDSMVAEGDRLLALYGSANLDLAVAGGEAWVSSFKADRVYHVPLP
jgi:DNA-binding beta-propeller fold protein YncE